MEVQLSQAREEGARSASPGIGGVCPPMPPRVLFSAICAYDAAVSSAPIVMITQRWYGICIADSTMAPKAVVYKFSPTDKARIKGKVGHTRTGACHGMKPNSNRAKAR